MASVTARLSVLGENLYGDQEQDANSLLIELDKGLCSGKAGDQCEAIVRFPRLFEKYPFPILINSSFLKVATVFRCGSNFIRLCILQVTQQSQKHLEKIISVDEFVRRIYAVIHSNDPVARAITLRTLGSTACISANFKNVHHSIINSLDSNDQVELEAAIAAATAFVSRSRSFASSICGKLAEMVQSLSIPVVMKLKIISVFEHMTCNLETSQRVRSLCTEMLICHPSCKFILAILHTLTKLSVHSLVTIPDQMDLLLDYLRRDARRAVKLSCLKNLCLLAQRAPHMWTEAHVAVLCEFLKMETSGEDLQLGLVSVLATLSRTVAVTHLSSDPNSPEMQCCIQFCYHGNLDIALKAVEMFISIILQVHRDSKTPSSNAPRLAFLLDGVCSVLEMMLGLLIKEDFNGKGKKHVGCLRSIVTLCRAVTPAADRFVHSVASLIKLAKGEYAVCLCDCLSAIGCLKPGLLDDVTPSLLTQIDYVLTSNDNQRERVLLSLVRLVFGASTEDGLSASSLETINRVLAHVNGWTAYKIARQAGRYGHYALAAAIFGKLTTSIATEHNYFWLTALKECCLAESFLLDSPALQSCTRSVFVEQLMKAELCYQQSIIAIKAAASPSNPLAFQVEYLHLRSKMIQSFVLLIQACCSFLTNPPPAIATSLTMTTGLEKHRCEHVLGQLSKCNEKFKNLEEKFEALYRSSFDSDLSTLTNLNMLRERCQLVTHVLDVILSDKTRNDLLAGPLVGVSQLVGRGVEAEAHDGQLEAELWNNMKAQVLELLQRSRQKDATVPLTHQDIECLEQTAYLLGRWRQCLPRFMFQRLQTTDIKLAVSPSKSSTDAVLVHHDVHLTLKVEGVIQMGGGDGSLKRFHHVDRVQLVVYSQLQSRTNPLPPSAVAAAGVDSKMPENPINRMLQTTKARNDYFHSEFILLFPVPGLHLVTVEAAIIDKDGDVWNTGPEMTVLIKSYDEAIQKQQQVTFANRHLPPAVPRMTPGAIKLE